MACSCEHNLLFVSCCHVLFCLVLCCFVLFCVVCCVVLSCVVLSCSVTKSVENKKTRIVEQRIGQRVLGNQLTTDSTDTHTHTGWYGYSCSSIMQTLYETIQTPLLQFKLTMLPLSTRRLEDSSKIEAQNTFHYVLA